MKGIARNVPEIKNRFISYHRKAFVLRISYITLNLILFLFLTLSLHFVKAEGNCYNLSDKNVESQNAVFQFRCNEEKAKLSSHFQKFRKEGEFIFSESEDGTPSGAIYLSKSIRRATIKIRHLTQISDLLGGDALALNLAAAALDAKKIGAEDYIKEIEKINSENHSELQENEKFIHTAISVATKILQHKEGGLGQLSFRILSILGYLPDCHDHSKDFHFLTSVTKSNISDVFNALSVLQKYGLILKILSDDSDGGTEKILVFVNPLFLPVIRYEGREERQKTLEMILNSSGFQEYKYAAMEFADEDLLNKYPEMKSVLIDHPLMANLAENEKYEKALRLSAGIHEVVKTRETLYNYGKIMEYAGNITGALDIFQCLYNHYKIHSNVISSDILSFWDDYSDKGIVDIKQVRLDGRVVEGNLLLLMYKSGNRSKIKELLQNRTDFFMLPKRIQDTMNVLELIKGMKYELIDEFNWPPYNKFNSLIIVGKDNVENKVILHNAQLHSNIKWPSNLKYLKLYEPIFSDPHGNKYSEFDVSPTIRTNLTRFTLSHGNPKQEGSKLKVSLHKLANVSEIILADGIIISLKRKQKIRPRLLEWGNVSFIQPPPKSEKILLNDFVDFSRIKKLKIHDGTQRQLKIDLRDPVTIDDLLLNGIEVSNWKNASWTVRNLYLRHMNFLSATNMNIRQLEIISSVINLSALPNTIEKITMWEDADVTNDENICLPKLRTLVFGDTNHHNTLQMFSNCSSLVDLEFKHTDSKVYSNTQLRLNPEKIPKSVKNIKSSYNIQIYGGKDLYLDKLILERNLDDWNSIPSKLKPNHVILKAYQLDVNNKGLYNELLSLLERFQILTIGEFNWSNIKFEDSLLSKLVNSQSKYYTFENNTVSAINWTSFVELSNHI